MGLTRSYAFLPADHPPPAGADREAAAPGWAQWHFPRIPWENLEELAAAGPAVLAKVSFSDYCTVAGYAAGEQRWLWSYGYDTEDDEDTLPQRSAAVARQIAAWAREIGHPEPDPDALLTALRAGNLFADGSLLDLSFAIGLDALDIPRLPGKYRISAFGPAEYMLTPTPTPPTWAPPRTRAVTRRPAPAVDVPWPAPDRLDDAAVFSIVTDRDLIADREAVCDWLEAVRTGLLDPVIAAYAEAGGAVEYGDDAPQTPNSLGVCADLRTSTGRYLDARADAASWGRLIGWARAGKLAQLGLYAGVADGRGHGEARWGAFNLETVLRPDPESTEHAPTLAIKLPEPMARLAGRDALLAAFQDLAGRALGDFDPVSGCLDYGPDVWPAAPALDWTAKIKGVAWMLLLGQRHLDQLGGMDAVRQAYPFASVEAVGQLWWFRTTADPHEFDEGQRELLAAALTPVLAAA